MRKYLFLSYCSVVLSGFCMPPGGLDFVSTRIFAPTTAIQKDSVAERVLLYQRSNGGWPQPKGNPINYAKPLTELEARTVATERENLDTTIDDGSTTREIEHLMAAYGKTRNRAYLRAAERGIAFLLSAHNAAGGWPQFYPDSSSYRGQITYNDQAMVNVLWVMDHTANRRTGFEMVNKTLAARAKQAVDRGVQCILKTQYQQQGRLTAWCAQHDRKTLKPVKARSFELPSLSASESVGIVQFLLHLDNPSPEVRRAIHAAVSWLKSVEIPHLAVKTIIDSSQSSGRDRVVVPDSSSTLWARFYDLDTNQPFFCGRDGVKKSALADIENERRVGYAWYGTWPARLIHTDYPNWVKKWGT